MDRIDVRVEQADGDGLHPLRDQLADDAPGSLLVEGAQNTTVGQQALADLAPQVARHEGGRRIDEEVVHVIAPLVTDLHRIAEPLGHHQRCAGALALDERVGGQGRAVHDSLDVAGGHAGLAEERDHAGLHTVRRIFGGGEHFADAERPRSPRRPRPGR